MRILHLIFGLAAVFSAQAGEYAVLGNGFRLHADRHEVDGDKIRLYTDGGVTEMQGASVERFEIEEAVVAVPATPPPIAPPAAKAPETVASPAAKAPADLATAAAAKFSLPAGFVKGVMKTESGFRPAIVSPKGAIGLMQLMPGTARDLGVDPNNPKQNAEGGAQYLHDLLAKYESHPDQVFLALAAYNAGPAAVERYHGVPPYRETREYILRVLKNWERPEAHK